MKRLLGIIKSDNADLLQNYLDDGLPTHFRLGGAPLLALAARHGSTHCIDALVKAGAQTTGRWYFSEAKTRAVAVQLAAALPAAHPECVFIIMDLDLPEILRAALDAGADPNAADVAGSTALMRAARAADGAVVDMLLAAGADADACNSDGFAVCHLADIGMVRRMPVGATGRLRRLVEADLVPEVQAELSAGAELEQPVEDSEKRPLALAVDAGAAGVARLLLDAGADPTAGLPEIELVRAAKDPDLRSLVARALPQDHPGRIHAFAVADLGLDISEAAAAGADVDTFYGKYGYTALIESSMYGNLKAMQALIEAGSKVTKTLPSGKTALSFSTSRKASVALARAWPADHPSYLHVLAQCDLGAEIELSAANGVGLEGIDQASGRRPLMVAAQADALTAAGTLIRLGADVTAVDDVGQTALEYTRSPEMRTALALAWPRGVPGRLTALVTARLHTDLADELKTPSHINEIWGLMSDTPLITATRISDAVAVKLLLEAGADVHIKNTAGFTALRQSKSPEILKLLNSHHS